MALQIFMQALCTMTETASEDTVSFFFLIKNNYF